MSGGVHVFIGSCTSQAVEEAVMVDSMLRHATCHVDIDVILGDRHCIRNVGSGTIRPLPDEWRGRISRNTPFSYARFVPPALCGYRGRVIYCEADMLTLGDVAELWDHPLDGASFAAVPHRALRAAPSPFQTEGFLSSTVVYDAARCGRLDVVAVTGAINDGVLSYSDAISLTDRFLEHFDLTVAPLHQRWNDLEWPKADTAIVHFTSSQRRPWLHPHQPAGELWTGAYLEAIASGALDRRRIDDARRAGGISARVRWLPRIPARCRRLVDAAWQQLERWASWLRRTWPPVRRAIVRFVRRSIRYVRKRLPASCRRSDGSEIVDR